MFNETEFLLKSEPESFASSEVKFYDGKNYLTVFEKQHSEIEIYNDPGLPVKNEADSAQEFSSSFEAHWQPCDSPTSNGATTSLGSSTSSTEDVKSRSDVSSDHVTGVGATEIREQQHLTLPVKRTRRPSTSHTATQLPPDAKLPRLQVQDLMHSAFKVTSVMFICMTA